MPGTTSEVAASDPSVHEQADLAWFPEAVQRLPFALRPRSSHDNTTVEEQGETGASYDVVVCGSGRTDSIVASPEDDFTYYLFDQVICFGFASTRNEKLDPAVIALDHNLQSLIPKLTDGVPEKDTPLMSHPLWSTDKGGIVLYEDLRDDGRTRTFFRSDQIHKLVLAAYHSRDIGQVWASPALDRPVERYRVGIVGNGLQKHPVPRVYRTVSQLAGIKNLNTTNDPAGRDMTSVCRVLPSKAKHSIPVGLVQQPPLAPSKDNVIEDARRDYLYARSCYNRSCGTWITLDLEASRKEPTLITEIGIALSSAPEHVPSVQHLIVVEHEYCRDKVKNKNYFVPFAFGNSQRMSLTRGLELVSQLIDGARSQGPVFISCHDLTMELRFLQVDRNILPRASDLRAHDPQSLPRGFVAYFDTQVLYSGKTGTHSVKNNRVGMMKMMKHLGVAVDKNHWHNAGNDAMWTLTAVHEMLGEKERKGGL